MNFLSSIVKLIDTGLRVFLKLITFLKIRPLVAFILRGFARIFLFLLFKFYFRLEVLGHENIPKEGGVLLASNHQSYLDPPLLALCVWRIVTFVSKIENFETPILGPLVELGGAFPIVRGGDDQALEFFEDFLKKGKVIAIFPEGTIPAEEEIPRSAVEPKTGLLKGKTGAIRLALKAHVPIVPVGLSGVGKALPPEAVPRGQMSALPKPVKITVKFGNPIDFSYAYEKPLTRELLRELTDGLMCKISDLVDHSRNFIPQKVPVTEKTYTVLRKFEEDSLKG